MDNSTEAGMSSEATLAAATQNMNLEAPTAPLDSFWLAPAPMNLKLPEFWAADPDH
jgi:hypothetical protein